MSSNVFDVIKNINTGKDFSRETTRELLPQYNPFVINKAFSLHLDTIFHANEMNMNQGMSNEMQYFYYMYSLKNKSRYAKWPKKSKTKDEDIMAICRAYSVSYKRAITINKLLTPEQLGVITARYKDANNE